MRVRIRVNSETASICRGGKSVETVAGKLVRRDIIADVASPCPRNQQVTDKVPEALLSLDHAVTPMQERCELASAVSELRAHLSFKPIGNERVGLEHSFQPLASVPSSVTDFGEMFQFLAFSIVGL